MDTDSLTNKRNTNRESFNHKIRQLLKFEDDCLQQMQRDVKNVAAPVSAAVLRVMTPGPPRTANTTVVEVQFLQCNVCHILFLTC